MSTLKVLELSLTARCGFECGPRNGRLRHQPQPNIFRGKDVSTKASSWLWQAESAPRVHLDKVRTDVMNSPS